MKIAIKSETDSRHLMYPLLKVLSQYGTVALFTSHPYAVRLIEDELEGGFRNIVIVPVMDGNLRAAEEEDEMYKDKYDYTVYDNVGCIDYDYLLCMVTNHITEEYVEDLKMVIDEEGVQIIKFGKPAPKKKNKPEPPKKKPAPKKKFGKKGEEPAEEEVEEETPEVPEDNTPTTLEEKIAHDGQDVPDEEFNKWNLEKTEDDILVEKINLGDKNSKWCKFSTFEQMEELESRHRFYKPDDSVLKEIFRILGQHFGVEERMFMKAGRLADDSNTIVQGIDIS